MSFTYHASLITLQSSIINLGIILKRNLAIHLVGVEKVAKRSEHGLMLGMTRFRRIRGRQKTTLKAGKIKALLIGLGGYLTTLWSKKGV